MSCSMITTITRLSCIVLVLLGLSTAKGNEEADWPLFRGDSLSTGVARGDLPESLKEKWQFKVKEGAFDATPVIVGQVVYIGDLDGTVYALDLETGEAKWQRKFDTSFLAAAAVRDGRLFIGDIDGLFYCLSTDSGKTLWTYESMAEIDSGANFYGEHVLFGSQDATLYCVNAKTGKLEWKFEISDQIRCTPDRGRRSGVCRRLRRSIAHYRFEEGRSGCERRDRIAYRRHARGAGPRAFFGTEAGTFFAVELESGQGGMGLF